VPYNPKIHRRRSTRLRHYDYATPGCYFVTICTHQRQYLFGEICDGSMKLNGAGQAAQAHWQRLARHFTHIQLDVFVVMPNHVHGIIQIVELPNVFDAHAADRSSPTSGRGEAFCEQRIDSLAERDNQNASPLRSMEPQRDRPYQSSSNTLAKKSIVSFSAAMKMSISSRVL